MAKINRFPIELLLHIFSYLTLKSLIASHGVCRRWRQFVPVSDILPTRRALFQLYLELVSSPYFPQTRPWTLAKLQPFDRDAYVATLLGQHNYIPEPFRLWVLEWPARAVFGCVWPCLPCIEIAEDVADDVERLEGCNWLGSAQVSIMTWIHHDAKYSTSITRDLMPGLLIRSSCNGYTWLMLDKREGKRDKVYEIAESQSVINGEDGDDFDVVHANWVDFQRTMWTRIEHAASKRESTRTTKPSLREVRSYRPPRMPARAWSTAGPRVDDDFCRDERSARLD